MGIPLEGFPPLKMSKNGDVKYFDTEKIICLEQRE
jgi:hypothetical protein